MAKTSHLQVIWIAQSIQTIHQGHEKNHEHHYLLQDAVTPLGASLYTQNGSTWLYLHNMIQGSYICIGL